MINSYRKSSRHLVDIFVSRLCINHLQPCQRTPLQIWDTVLDISSYFDHKGSDIQFLGNPIASVSTLGYMASNALRPFLNSTPTPIELRRYWRQHNCGYSFEGEPVPPEIQALGSFDGNWGLIEKTLFQVLAWCAQQLRRTAIDVIQLSRKICWGSPRARATFFFTALSEKLLYILDNVPKEATSRLFHTGG